LERRLDLRERYFDNRPKSANVSSHEDIDRAAELSFGNILLEDLTKFLEEQVKGAVVGERFSIDEPALTRW
jgi:hypothetical protein